MLPSGLSLDDGWVTDDAASPERAGGGEGTLGAAVPTAREGPKV
jgi:hypothetical protein